MEDVLSLLTVTVFWRICILKLDWTQHFILLFHSGSWQSWITRCNSLRKRWHITFELTFDVVAVTATLLSCSAVLKVVVVMSLSMSRSPTLHLKANISTTVFGINDMRGTFCDNSADMLRATVSLSQSCVSCCLYWLIGVVVISKMSHWWQMIV